LLTTFTLSLGYEVYRDIAKAGVSSFDTFNPVLVIFYLIGFGMTVLVRTNQRWAWGLVLLFTLGLIALGTHLPVTRYDRSTDDHAAYRLRVRLGLEQGPAEQHEPGNDRERSNVPSQRHHIRVGQRKPTRDPVKKES
jgi:hypothetical protein